MAKRKKAEREVRACSECADLIVETYVEHLLCGCVHHMGECESAHDLRCKEEDADAH